MLTFKCDKDDYYQNVLNIYEYLKSKYDPTLCYVLKDKFNAWSQTLDIAYSNSLDNHLTGSSYLKYQFVYSSTNSLGDALDTLKDHCIVTITFEKMIQILVLLNYNPNCL